MHTEKKDHVKAQGEDSCLQIMEKDSQETNSANTFILDF